MKKEKQPNYQIPTPINMKKTLALAEEYRHISIISKIINKLADV